MRRTQNDISRIFRVCEIRRGCQCLLARACQLIWIYIRRMDENALQLSKHDLSVFEDR